MMDIVDGIRTFVATVETGSFTGAARRLGVSNKLASKYVAELEARLGVRLLQRTTRRLGMTPDGERLMARAPAWLEELDDMLGEMAADTQGFTGMIRVSAPVTFGELYVQDMLRRFAAPHPGLVIDLRLSDAYADLAAEGIDLAFRIGDPGGNAVVARRLADIHSVVVASDAYLARHGVPQAPEDLAGHDCILDTNHRGGTRWLMTANGRAAAIDVRGQFMVNSARAARDLAVAGQGIAFCPDFVVADDLAAGRLKPVLADTDRPAHPLNVVYLEGRKLSRKVRALIDFAVEDAKAAGCDTLRAA